MNKNVIISILVIVIVAVGGYYLFTNNQNSTVTDQNNITTPNTPTTTPTVPETPKPGPSLTLGTPSAETSSNASTSNSTALVNGQVTPNGVLTTYWFDYGETQSLGSKTKAEQIGSGFSSISSPQYITGLKSNTTYYFRLSANNNFGTISGNTYSFQTNNTPPLKAAVPTVHTSNASSIMRTTANLNGQVNPNGWQTSYWFEYGKDSNFGNVTSITLVTTSGSLSSSSTVVSPVATLDPLTKYYFRLNAQNQFGTVNGTTLSFTTQGPLNPGVPAVTTNQSSNITSVGARLNGNINPNGADTSYWFEYSTDPSLGSPISTTTQTVASGTKSVSVNASVVGLTKNTKYYYHLVGKNQYGTMNGSIDSFTTRNQ